MTLMNKATSYTLLFLNMAEQPEEINVFLIGNDGAGKSTILSNLLFGTWTDEPVLPLGDFRMSITKNDVTFTEIHVANLELPKYVRDKTDILVYCIPVCFGSKFGYGNPAILQSLQKAFGKDEWKHCIVVFTFSNLVWDRIMKRTSNKNEAITIYKQYLQEHSALFSRELTKLKVPDMKVETVFDCQLQPPALTTIPAIPAGDEPSTKYYQISSL